MATVSETNSWAICMYNATVDWISHGFKIITQSVVRAVKAEKERQENGGRKGTGGK
jgi:hypothetical protein